MRRLLALVALLAIVAVPVAASGAPLSMSRSVSFVDASNGFMGGSTTSGAGFISRTSDGGATWSAAPVIGAPRLNVHALGGGVGFAVSPFAQSPFKTSNFGASWGSVPGALTANTCQPWDVRQLSPTVAIAVGEMDHPVHGDVSAIWRTADAGNTWTLVDSGPIYPYDEVKQEYPQTIARHYAVDADSTGQVVYALGREQMLTGSGEDYYEVYKQPVIRRSTDGGLTWTARTVDAVQVPDPGFEDVSVVNTNTAYAVGYRRVYRTTDGGVSWAVLPSGAYQYLRLTNYGPVETEAVDSTSSSHLIVAGALDSSTNARGTIARSIDGGVTWNAYVDAAKLTFRDVSIISPTRAVAVGDDNLVVILDLNPDGTMTLVKRLTATNGDFSVDLTPPSVTVTPEYSSKLTKVTLSALDNSQVQDVSYRINTTTTWTTVAGNTATINLTRLGANTIEYRAKDINNNVSTPVKVTVYVKLGTSLSLTAPSTSAYASAKVTGYLKDVNGKALASKRVVVQSWTSGAWKSLGTATTASNGSYAYTVKPTATTVYRAVFSSDTTLIGTNSSNRAIKPKVYLTTPTTSTTQRYGSYYTIYGYLKPRHTAGTYPVKLYAEHYESGRYVPRGTYSAKASDYTSNGYTYTKYSAKVKLPRKGKWRIRVYHASDSQNAATYSSYRYVTVK